MVAYIVAHTFLLLFSFFLFLSWLGTGWLVDLLFFTLSFPSFLIFSFFHFLVRGNAVMLCRPNVNNTRGVDGMMGLWLVGRKFGFVGW